MQKKIIIIIGSTLLCLLLIMTVFFVINKNSSNIESGFNNSFKYTELSSQYKDSNYRFIDGNTDLTNDAEITIGKKRQWEARVEAVKGNPTAASLISKPNFSSSFSSITTPKELIKALEDEQGKILEIKKKYDSFDCDKEKSEEIANCKTVKRNLEITLPQKYEKLINDYKNW